VSSTRGDSGWAVKKMGETSLAELRIDSDCGFYHCVELISPISSFWAQKRAAYRLICANPVWSIAGGRAAGRRHLQRSMTRSPAADGYWNGDPYCIGLYLDAPAPLRSCGTNGGASLHP
jgi:hypothetical protein